MGKKQTPQDVFDAMREALKKARPTVQAAYLDLPERWEDVNLEQRDFFVHMAWSINLIAGEYMLEENNA